MCTSNHCSQISLDAFSEVVEAVYDCAFDPNHWHDIVRMIADLSGSQRCTFGVHDYANGCDELIFQFVWEDASSCRLHKKEYSHLDPLFPLVRMMGIGDVAARATLMEDSEFETRYYQEWVKPQCQYDMIALITLQAGQRTGLLVANRDEDHPQYGERDVRLFALVSRHICRAVAISDSLHRKTTKSQTLETTLNTLATAIYLMDFHGRVVFMNRAAKDQVKTGKVLRIENKHLVPIDRVARLAMSKAITEAIADETGPISLSLPDGESGGLFATILPLGREERGDFGGAFEATAVVFVQDPIAAPPFPGEAFSQLYGLTGAELRVLLAMSPGRSVREAAETLGISEATAKTHLQRIYAKTGTSKQTMLMHLFMSSAPPVKAA